VWTLETRDALASIRLPSTSLAYASHDHDGIADKGFEGGGGGESVRRDFRQSVYFNPSLVTDANGHAHATFKLPDSLTTYRVMAVRSPRTILRFGGHRGRRQPAADGATRISARARAGDAIDAGISFRRKVAKTKIEVEAKAEGVTLTSGDRKRSTSKRTVRGPLRIQAEQAEGQGHLPREGRRSERRGRDHPHRPLARVAGSGRSLRRHDGRRRRSSAISRRCATMGGLDLSVSSTALVGLGGGVSSSSNIRTAAPSS
jgi:uncharacterized protein YfaS (alpha-2-macroglobulin family)